MNQKYNKGSKKQFCDLSPISVCRNICYANTDIAEILKSINVCMYNVYTVGLLVD